MWTGYPRISEDKGSSSGTNRPKWKGKERTEILGLTRLRRDRVGRGGEVRQYTYDRVLRDHCCDLTAEEKEVKHRLQVKAGTERLIYSDDNKRLGPAS